MEKHEINKEQPRDDEQCHVRGFYGNVPFAAFSEGEEPPMTACGGNLIGGEISRNEQCPHEADLR